MHLFKEVESSDGGVAEEGAGADALAGPDAPSSPESGAGHDAGDAGVSGSDGGGAPEASGDDAPATIETVVSGMNQATLVRVDANNVYFGDEGTTTGNVYQCPKTGCATPDAARSGVRNRHRRATDERLLERLRAAARSSRAPSAAARTCPRSSRPQPRPKG